MLTKEELPACPVATTVQMIGSKWKLLIMRNLLQRPWRFNELKKDLEGISQKVLTDSLRSMEADGIITRTVYPEVPPRVEYALSDLGESMRPIMDAMEIWGTEYKKSRNKKHQACRSNSTGLMFSCFLYHSQKSGSGRWLMRIRSQDIAPELPEGTTSQQGVLPCLFTDPFRSFQLPWHTKQHCPWGFVCRLHNRDRSGQSARYSPRSIQNYPAATSGNSRAHPRRCQSRGAATKDSGG